jgi:hypothetical protein
VRRLALPVVLGGVALCLVGGLALTLALAKPTTENPPDYQVVGVGGLDYQLMLGRLLDPSHPVDAAILRGVLELVVHDPARPAQTASVVV